MVVEGVGTTRAAASLAERLDVEMPITRGTHQVLFGGEDPERVLWDLMTRSRKHESEEIARGYKDW
jgi:glycerol-3-phosphate dehydrogenase (NAD(P)+)